MQRVLFLFWVIPFLASQTVTEVEITFEPSYHVRDFSRGYYQVFSVEVAPHSGTLLHRHRQDYVSVTLGDAHVLYEVRGKPPVDLNLKDGDTRFTPGNFAHVVKNLSDQPFRNVTVELLQDGTRASRESVGEKRAAKRHSRGACEVTFHKRRGAGI